MSASIGTTRVEDIMMTNVVTVSGIDKMEDVAEVFETQDINAAPVVDPDGKCIGIITSHDLVEYEATRVEMANELRHGYQYDLAKYGDGSSPKVPGKQFNEVNFHMTRTVQTVDRHHPLSRVVRVMCSRHIHHAIVLDEETKPIGIVSSLDILGHILGVPVWRKSGTPNT